MKWLRWKLAWFRWRFTYPYRPGDPTLGVGEERARNRRILWDRWYAREPKREDF